MPTRRMIRTLASSLLLVFAFASAAAASEVVRGGTFALGDDACDDTEPEVATQPDGTFLAVWQRCDPSRIAAQRFDSIGRRLGSEIDLGTGWLPQVAALPDRGYAVAYLGQLTPDFEIFGVFARRLGPTGLPLADAARIDEEGEDSQVAYAVPRLAAAPDGRLFVAWRNLIFAPFPLPFPEMPAFGRMLEADLAPHGPTFDLGAADLFNDIDVSLDEAGRALAVTVFGGLISRRFDESGAPIGNLVEVGGGSLEVFNPRLAPRPGGGWWLVWNEGGAPQASSRVLLRALDADGHTAGPRIDIGLLGSIVGTLPAVGVDPDGLVLVTARDRSGELQQRLFDATGAPVSDLAPLADLDSSVAGRAALAESSATGFVALWQGGAHLGPFPPTLTGWDLFGALLASSCPSPNAVCAGVGSALAEVEVRWRLGNLSGVGRGLRLGRHLLFTVENPGRFDVAIDLSGGAIDWAATTIAAVEIRWTEGDFTHSVVKPSGRFASGRLKIPTSPALVAPVESAVVNKPAGALAADGCAPSARTACLFDERFRVTAFATGADGVERPAEVLAFADRQTILSFAEAGNATFSLLDGRAINGKFWVHWGGLSTAAFRIEVTDLSTGTARTYTNPAGRRQSQADRGAF